MAKAPHPIDIYVGSRLRFQRQMRNMSQTALANALGVTFQQVQKYEKGTNRISASRLQTMSGLLGVPVSFFFNEGGEETASLANLENNDLSNQDTPSMLSSSAVLNLNRAFLAIKNPSVRRSVIALVKAVASEDESSHADHD